MRCRENANGNAKPVYSCFQGLNPRKPAWIEALRVFLECIPDAYLCVGFSVRVDEKILKQK
jgi:hypothetical protein